MSKESPFDTFLKWAGWKANEKPQPVQKEPLGQTESPSPPEPKAVAGADLYEGSEWGRDQEGNWREPEPHFMKFLSRHSSKIGPDVLDVGCGVGRHILPLAERGYNITGLDSSPSMLQTAAERTSEYSDHINLQNGNHQKLEFANGSFDTVVSSQTFQFHGGEKSFLEAARVLKPGGLFFLRVRSTERYDKSNPRARLLSTNKQGGQEWVLDRPHDKINYHHFSLQELQHLADLSNLEIIDEPVDERKNEQDGSYSKGQWNIVFRKKEKNAHLPH
ncbi:MAG: methyltransferase domain-containing protein [Parcubacteria group bacterium]